MVTVDFSGGQSGNFTAWTEVSPSFVQDLNAVTGPTRQTLEGTYAVRIEAISVAGGSGFSGYTLTYGGSGNGVYIDGPNLSVGASYNIFNSGAYDVRPRLEKTANAKATFQRRDFGGTVREYKETPVKVYDWSPAKMCGYFQYSLPTTQPIDVGVSLLQRNATVTWTAPSDLGDSAITKYIVQYQIDGYSLSYADKIGGYISSVDTTKNTITMATPDPVYGLNLGYGATVYFSPVYLTINGRTTQTPGGTSAYTPYYYIPIYDPAGVAPQATFALSSTPTLPFAYYDANLSISRTSGSATATLTSPGIGSKYSVNNTIVLDGVYSPSINQTSLYEFYGSWAITAKTTNSISFTSSKTTAVNFTGVSTGIYGPTVDLTAVPYGTVYVYGSYGHATVNSTSRSYTFSDLYPGSTYTFRVSAVNAVGASIPAYSGSITVPSLGYKWVDGIGFTRIDNAARYDGTRWVPLTSAKRYDGSFWTNPTITI